MTQMTLMGSRTIRNTFFKFLYELFNTICVLLDIKKILEINIIGIRSIVMCIINMKFFEIKCTTLFYRKKMY